MKTLLISIAAVLLLNSCINRQHKITYDDVASRLTDLEALAELPEEGEQSAMWSSYDRRSRYDSETDRYIEWFANGDGAHQQIRMEGENAVLAEMEGPGAIVRIWSARPDTGHVKIYIDGNDTPVVDLPFVQFFDRSTEPFHYEGLVYEASRGCNNYVPITYNKSCKVVASPGWGVYYHFNYITFKTGTVVEPFSMDLSEDAKKTLSGVNEFILNRTGEAPYAKRGEDVRISEQIEIKPGEKVVLADIQGAKAIKSFKVFPAFADRKDEMTGLRKLVLSMYWDDDQDPSVWTPLGDFFGTTPAINYYRTLPTGMTETYLYSYWYMPFSEGARMVLENQGSQSWTIGYELVYEPLEKSVDTYGRFHAWWHSDILPVEEDRWPDWTLLETTGRGRYVGTMLHVMNPAGDGCREAAGEGQAWWGEGDEKFFVDDEHFPSTFGTGSEDYFGYAWGNPELFEKAFHSQSMTTGNKAHQTLNRWHIIDNIPFQESFRGYIEKYYPNDCGTRYNSVVFWYLSADGDHALPYTPITVDNVLMPPEFDAKSYFAAPGGEVMVKLSSTWDEIRYTLDGSAPDQNSLLYEDGITLSKSAVVTARCFRGDAASPLSTASVTILEWVKPVDAPVSLSHGLNYDYFERDGQWQVLPDFSAMEPLKSGTVEKVRLEIGEREEHWGVVYSGYIRIGSKGVYAFYLNSDDGSRLYINDQCVVDNDKNHAETEVEGKVALEKGLYRFRVEFFENEQSQVLEALYSGPGIDKQEVPEDVLFKE